MRRRHVRPCLAGLLAVAMTACAAAPLAPGERASLTGKIRVQGTALFPMVVLLADDRQAWELTGITAAKAQPLAGRQATVSGIVLRAPGPDVWMPAIRIEGMPEVVP